MRNCGNCKHAELCTPNEKVTLGSGQSFVWCKASGPKLAPSGLTTFPTMMLTGSCSLHEISLSKLFKGHGAA